LGREISEEEKIGFIKRIIATGLFIGYLPIAPATFACLISIIIWYLLFHLKIVFIIVAVVLFFIGVSLSNSLAKIWGKDPHQIVIDEYATFLLPLYFTPRRILPLGGMLGYIITTTPGSSQYFKGGIIAYDNNIKVKLVGVDVRLLKRYGAVSMPVAKKMAVCISRKFKTDIGVGITGIAGPGGGTVKKPVGLVYIAVLFKKKIFLKKLQLKGRRDTIRKKSVENVLLLLKELLNG